MNSLPNLLIVDDSEKNLMLLTSVIRKLKINLIQALSGFEALEKVQGVELALAIIDVRMPGMDGYELAKKLNADRTDDKVPVIFLTANYIDKIEVFKGYDSGAVEYISKPVDNYILLCKINVFLDLFNQKQTVKKDAALLKRSADELIWVNDALKKSEARYRTMIKASPDGIFITDLKGVVTEVSEAGLVLTGSNATDELIGKNFSMFAPPDEKEKIDEILKKTITEGHAQNIEIRLLKKDQSLFVTEVSAALLNDPAGNPISVMIIIRDISQRKKLEMQLIHSDRLVGLGEMASGIAHEINQPLNTISMVMDNILSEIATDEKAATDYILRKSTKIFDNITRIKNIIDHIRVFSRNHDDYIITDFNINSSIENAISMISEQFKHNGIDLRLELDDQLPHIKGNTYKFEQVILNLLSNAKDALQEKENQQKSSFEKIIKIKSYTGNSLIFVEVSDTGTGISPENINQVLLPFFTTKETGKGTGLGLSVSYQIIQEMRGTIEFSSILSAGTTIKITLKNQN